VSSGLMITLFIAHCSLVGAFPPYKVNHNLALGTGDQGLGKENLTLAPAARFFGYFSRKGRKGAKE